MANDKKFVVKNGLQANNVAFVNESNASNIIEASMLSTDTLSFSGNAGQLFSISDTMSGVIFGVNDVSGVPSIEVDDTGDIRLAELGGNVSIGTTLDTHKLYVQGNSFVNGAFTVNGNFTVTDVTVSGNLTVSGTTTYINTTSLNVGDNIITLNADLPGATAPTENAGIEINRGSSANVQFIWDETNDRWSTNGQPLALSSLLATSSINAASFTVGSNFIANTTGAYHTGVINSASFTVGSNFIANTAGAYHTGSMNAATLSVGSSFVANTTGAYHSALVNSASFTVGSNFVANTTRVTLAVPTLINNQQQLRFQTVNTSAYAYMVQQNDDNFVFYTSNTTYGQRAVWSIFANSITSSLNVDVALRPSAGLIANNTIGSSGQVLKTNGSTLYWDTAGGTGTVTQVVAANGLSGGTINATGQIDVVGAAGLVSNSSGVHIGQGNGINVSADAISVTGGTTLTVNATGVHVNTANLVIATSQLSGDVALGANTSGNYVATISNANGISGNSATEGGTPTIGVVTGTTLTVNAGGIHVNSALSITSLTLAGAASGITTLGAGNTTITGFANVSVSVNSAAFTVGSSYTANATTLRIASNSFFTQDYAAGTGSIGGFLSYNPESQMAIHPFLANDLANLRLRGGTVGANTNVPVSNAIFDSLFDSTPTYTQGFANTTANTILEFTNLPSELQYGSAIGISFGMSSWAPSSLSIDALSNGTWVSCYSNTAFNAAQVVVPIPGNAVPGTTAIRFTMGANTSTRIAHIWGYDYNSDGWSTSAMPRSGGAFYGSISVPGTFAAGNTTITGFANIVNGNVQLSNNYDIVSPDNFAIYDSTNTRDRFSFSTSNLYDTRSGGLHGFRIAGANVANVTANGVIIGPVVGTLGSTDDAFEIFPPSLASSHETRNYVKLTDLYNANGNGQAFYMKSITNSGHYGGWMLNSTWGAPILLGSASGDTAAANSIPTTFVRINQSSLSTTGLTFSTGDTTIAGFANVSVSVNSAAFTVGSTTVANTTGITTTVGANAINLTNATSNWIYWNSFGVGAPTAGTRSAGTKLVLYPEITASSVDYGIGIEGSHVWFSAAQASGGFKWYSNTTNIMTANTTGLLLAGTLSGVTTAAMGNTTITGFANVSVSVNSAAFTVGSTTVANATGVYATQLNGQLASFYTNATNISTGTLPYAQIPANIVNTTASFTYSGIQTYNANVVIGATGEIIINANAGISANGTFGTAGQMLTTNGTVAYWSTPITGVTAGAGLTGGGTSGGLTLNVGAGTGIVVSADDIAVNASYIATISANNASFLQTRTWEAPGTIGSTTANTGAFTSMTVNSGAVYRSDWIAGFQSTSDFTLGTLVTTDIPANVTDGDSFLIEITGKSYSDSNPPFKVIAQGYLYGGNIISKSGISYGGVFASYIKIFEEGGVLKFWWPTISYWNSFNVLARGWNDATNGTITRNRVTSITNIAEPTGTKKVQVNLATYMRADITATNAAEVRATIFRDSIDTAYYLDPGNTGTSMILAGNVGIGTTSSSARLHVNGAVRIEHTGDRVIDFIRSSANSYSIEHDTARMYFYNVTTTNTILSFTNGSNVGVGIGDATSKFQVNYGNPVSVPSAGAAGHATAFGTVGYGLATGVLTNGNAYLQATRWDGTATNYNLLLQPNGGNVGIGTTSITGKLDIVGGATQRKIQLSGSAFSDVVADLFISRTGTSNTNIAQAPSIQFGNATDASGIMLQGSSDFQIFTNNAGAGWNERFRLTNTGEVGIGNLGQPTRGNLDISLGNITTGGVERSIHFGYSVADFYGFKLSNINSPASTAAGTFSIQRGNTTAWTTELFINDSGLVGVGTTSPALKFVVSNRGAAGLELDPTAVASSPLIQSYNRSGAAYTQLTFDALEFVWRPSGTERMRLNQSGNLGFGSSTRQMINLWSNNYGIGVQNSTAYFRSDARFSWHRGGVHSDTENDAGAGGTVAMTLDSSSNLIVTGEVRGTLFRDTANSSFFVDPSSTSILSVMRANTVQFSDGTTAVTLSNGTYNLLNDRSGRVAIYLGGAGDQNNYYDNTNHYFRNTGGGLYATINVTGSFANAFYDTANNTYFAKPSGTSRLNALSLDTMVVTSGVTGLTTAPIVTQENNIGVTASWMPLTHQKAVYSSGYRTHLSTGLYKTADAWGSGATGWYAAIGGNDSYPTQAWYLTYDASILNSLGYVTTSGSFRAPLFYDSANTSFYVDLNAGSNVSGEFNIQHSGANGFKITSTSGTQAFWARTGYDTNGTATPAVSATNVMLQSSGSSAGTFTFVCGNTLALTVLGDYAQGAGSLRAPIFYDSANTSFYADYGASTIAASLNGRILGGFGADSTGGTLDWNHVTNSRSGSGASLLLGTDTNGPGGSIYFHPFNFEYASKDGSGNITQLAVAYGTPGDRMAMRGKYSGSWSGWCEFITNNGTTQTKTGSFVSSTDIRAPIFYDSANTSFYLDAASTGTSLNVAGAIVAAGNITAYSDIRVKNNIAVISYAINKLDKISGITYTRTDLKDKERRYAGVIAQEIEEVLPEAVFGDENTKTVDYNATIALLIQAVKEQQVLINNLEQRISLLENK